MASIKTIKNKYDLLSKRERFGLFQRAILRNDENEIDAIISASPKKTYDITDFHFLREEVFKTDTINVLLRLGHFGMFDYFTRGADEFLDRNESIDFRGHASVSAYLYVIETDAWDAVCDELGFEVNWYRQVAAGLSFSVSNMDRHDWVLRHMSFTEREAEEFMRTSSKFSEKMDGYNIKTIDEQIEFYRSLIEEV